VLRPPAAFGAGIAAITSWLRPLERDDPHAPGTRRALAAFLARTVALGAALPTRDRLVRSTLPADAVFPPPHNALFDFSAPGGARQIALVARALEPVERQLTSVLATEVCFRDPGVGRYALHNALWALGGTFLEVVAPIRDNTAGGRYLDRGGGDGGYMYILDCDDLDARRAQLSALGFASWRTSALATRCSGPRLFTFTPRTPGAACSPSTATPAGRTRWGATCGQGRSGSRRCDATW
jgi:hypothetical protein